MLGRFCAINKLLRAAGLLFAFAFLTPASSATLLQPGNVLLSNFNGSIDQYSPAGTLLQTYTSTTVHNWQGVAVTPDGYILSAHDLPTPGITLFDPATGSVVSSFSTPQTIFPLDVNVFSDGTIALLDLNNTQVTTGGPLAKIDLYSATGTFLRSIQSTATAHPAMTAPFGLALSSNGTLWASDSLTTANSLYHYQENGALIGSLTFPSNFFAWDLTIDPSDQSIWAIASPFFTGTPVVDHLSSTGALLSSFPIPNVPGGERSISLDSDGTLLLTGGGTTAPNLVRYSQTGSLLQTFTLPANTHPIYVTTILPEPATVTLTLVLSAFTFIRRPRRLQ